VIDAPFALAFTGGMIATVNPCGFPMLPAYLSYFLGAERTTETPEAGVLRALAVAATVSAGFMVVFGLSGVILAWITHSVYDVAQWITLVIGATLVTLGVALLCGWSPAFSLPKLNRGGRTRDLGSMFVFGISYGVASLGCTMPLFFANLSGIVTRANVVSAISYFLVFGLGMALVLMVLTVAIALARDSIVRGMRRLVPYMHRLAGALLLVAGVYVGWYGIVEIRGTGGNHGVVRTVTNWSADIQTWITDVGAVRLGLILGLIVAVTVLVVLLRMARRAPLDTPASEHGRAKEVTH
jgi:cytochrome c biogenesis protein CcdA